MTNSKLQTVIDELSSTKQETSRKFFKPASFSALFFKDQPIPTGTENVFTFKITPNPGTTIESLIETANKYIVENMIENVSVQHRKVRNNAGFIVKTTSSSQQEAKDKIIRIMEQAILPNVASIQGGKELEKQEQAATLKL